MNVSTRQLQGFVLAAQLGSFSRAAERLHVTQAGLSKMVRELEAQLGTRLFDRTTRAVALTPAGHKLLPVARRAVEELAVAFTELHRIGEESRKTLRVGATPLVASRLLPAACERFGRTHPGVTVRLVELQRDRIEELVLEGELDMGLGIFLRKSVGVERRTLFESRLLCVSPARGARQGSIPRVGSMRWSELRGSSMVSLQPDNPVQQFIERHLRAHADVPDDRYAVNHIETQIAMAEIGTGRAIIPAFALAACASYRVRVDALRDPAVDIEFSRIVKTGREQPQALDAFCATVKELMRG